MFIPRTTFQFKQFYAINSGNNLCTMRVLPKQFTIRCIRMSARGTWDNHTPQEGSIPANCFMIRCAFVHIMITVIARILSRGVSMNWTFRVYSRRPPVLEYTHTSESVSESESEMTSVIASGPIGAKIAIAFASWCEYPGFNIYSPSKRRVAFAWCE